MGLPSLNLDAFVAVARVRSFTQAAERLHITQSALSQRIHNLEAELETALFVRDRAGVRLTPVGERLLRYCQTRDGLEDEFLSEVRSGSAGAEGSGVIRVGAFSSVTRSLVVPAVAGLAARGQAQVSLLTREYGELPGMLRRAEVDLILTGEKIERDDVESVLLGHEEYVLVEGRKSAASDWYLDHDESDETTLRYLRKFPASKKGAQVRRRYLDEIYALMDGVKLGLGRAVLPRHLIEGDRELEVVDPSRALRVPVWLHYWSQPYYSRLHRELVDALKAGAAETLAE